MEQVDHIAAWVAKNSPLLASIELQTNHADSYKACLDPAIRPAAFATLGSALQQAAALPQGLHLRSCKLADVNWDCTAFLQQLPVNSLTSLELHLSLNSCYDWDACVLRLAGVMAVLQQLRKLVLQVADKWAEDEFGRETYLERVDPLLQPLSGLTSLTSLEVGMMWSLK